MAQCYAESSKPIGGTFDMCGGGYTGRLYCSVYAGDNTNVKQYHQQGYAPVTRTAVDRSSNFSNVVKDNESSKKQQAQPKPPPTSDDSSSSSKSRKSGEIRRMPSDSSDKSSCSSSSPTCPKSSAKSSSTSSSPSSSAKSGKNSGEIITPTPEQQESLAKNNSISSSSSWSRQASAGSSRSAYQSWPSSPANFKPAPRTRHLSEGSFSSIFPEEHSAAKHRSGNEKTASLGGNPRTENATKLTTPSSSSSSSSSSTTEHSRIKRRERPRSYTGSPPRTTSSASSGNNTSTNIRHTRNASDGNWTNFSGGNLRMPPSSTSKPNLASNHIPSSGRSQVNLANINGSGFITGGSFARFTENKSDKPPPTEVLPPACCSYGNLAGDATTSSTGCPLSQAVKKGPTESYGTGNVYLMGESMLLKKALSSKDPEEVKNIGNEQYKKNHFMEALSLYDRAIMLAPGQASYHGNKGAALIALGRLAEAVHECLEAVHLDPTYSRAHQRLGALYVRMGRVEEAKRHFKSAGSVDPEESRKLETIARRLSRCQQARNLREWRTLLRDSDAAIDAGADSSLEAYALKAEALLNLNKLSEADSVISHAKKLAGSLAKPKNVVDERVYYTVQAQIDMAQGRFEDAVSAANKAFQNEPFNSEVSEFSKRVRKIGAARSQGNDLFKSGKYFEASAAYGEGLQLDPLNAVFFCNRAACRAKLRLWEKAIEDCNSALSIQTDYTKALLRRAQCNVQLQRWEDALRDYEVLKGKLPGDVEIARALFDVQVAIKRSKGEEIVKMKFGGEIEEVYSFDQFKEATTSPGLSVVHFISRWNERCRQITPFIDDLCKRYPSVTFVKVDIENHPCLAKTEHVGTVPTFKVYKNGLKMTEMSGPSQQKLEDAVQHYIL